MLQHDGVFRFEPVRLHHIALNTCRSFVRCSQHKKLYLAYIREVQKNGLGITVARAASTGVHHEVRWNTSETNAEQISSLKSHDVTEFVQNTSSPAVGPGASISNIPEPPAIPPEVTEQIVETVGGEPTFASLGLGGWSPVGLVQNSLEYLHIGCDLPWWTSIVIGKYVNFLKNRFNLEIN